MCASVSPGGKVLEGRLSFKPNKRSFCGPIFSLSNPTLKGADGCVRRRAVVREQDRPFTWQRRCRRALGYLGFSAAEAEPFLQRLCRKGEERKRAEAKGYFHWTCPGSRPAGRGRPQRLDPWDPASVTVCSRLRRTNRSTTRLHCQSCPGIHRDSRPPERFRRALYSPRRRMRPLSTRAGLCQSHCPRGTFVEINLMRDGIIGIGVSHGELSGRDIDFDGAVLRVDASDGRVRDWGLMRNWHRASFRGLRSPTSCGARAAART